jgi:hypothetical protein
VSKPKQTIGPNEFRCAACAGVFTKGWSDEEAAAERKDLFPGFERSDCELVCDDCFKAMGFA